jgi:hypothetical protein
MWIFFIFQASKIHISPTGTVSSLSPPQCSLSSDRCHHTATSCHASFPLSQDELAASASSPDIALSHHLPSRAETEALNPHHHCYTRSARLSPSTAIKGSSQPWPLSPPLNHVSILPPPLPDHHAIGAPPIVAVPFHHCIMPIVPSHNDTHGDKLVDPLSLLE